ncbi:uncharacterized protein Z518_04843 [Rhinocladiella mackenziei CBS 650.93]|uniref:Interferon-related developmental regulator N-terminal domain-containing protein n=1 Tax=Rhinocladiella mackenziei CBS 650.93 TaxID=1442369 RepID=A0A0D2FX07_9EURO|nr:uncharacterized protein Z518_04843 [Rhinocladiella mackenziei CBS 650.93]KIX06867.1 hypothetical protein Z518_04843 [Rhinocladiella mackenziei CBS 650.93]
MHEDLRRRALESGKTVSNRAKSKQSSRGSSRGNSAANSRVASRVQSRDVSDEEDAGNGNLSDDTTPSINSIDALLESDDFNEQTTDVLRQDLGDAISDLLDRKGSSTKSREDSLTTYVKCLTSHYLAEVLYGRVSELLTAFSRSIKAETSEKETTLALRAMALTAITFADHTLYDAVSALLKRSISDSQSPVVKAAAIYSIGICISFGGAGDEEIMDVMTFLLEIASSDGAFIGADDDADVVAAALNTYGFLTTQVDDVEYESEDAVATFLDQLDADNVKVQVAAGEDIALLYEKSYSPREEDEAMSSGDDDETGSSDELPAARDTSDLVKRYNAYHNAHEVLDKVTALASLSTKSMNRRDKRLLHQSFSSISLTVQNPKRGLQASNSSKMVVRIHREGEMRVDKWWKLMRLNAIRRLLGGGFVNHYFEGNKRVLDALPMILRAPGGDGMRSPRKLMSNKATKGRFRDSRRFVSGEFLEP